MITLICQHKVTEEKSEPPLETDCKKDKRKAPAANGADAKKATNAPSVDSDEGWTMNAMEVTMKSVSFHSKDPHPTNAGRSCHDSLGYIVSQISTVVKANREESPPATPEGFLGYI